MSFMEAGLTEKQEWVCVDRDGIEYLPADRINANRLRALLALASDSPNADDVHYARAAIVAMLRDYTEQVIDTGERWPNITIASGYGVRSSAPGYLDCTTWAVYPTLREARAAYSAERRECAGVE